MKLRLLFVGIVLLLLAALPACSAAPQRSSQGIDVVATTTIVSDVVQRIGGEQIHLTTLVKPGVDEHSFEPTAQDLVAITNAEVIFYNGAGLEPFMERLIASAGSESHVSAVSEGITLQRGYEGEEAAHAGEAEDEHEEGDPHVWTDPYNVMVWADNIAKALAEVDPANAPLYQERAAAYRQELEELDGWIRAQVEQVPAAQRKLVTDHTIFTYFASRYGFEQVGAVIPGYSTLSSPSAQEIAALEDNIRALGVPVIFTASSFNPALAERVASDTQTRLVPIQTGSLTGPDGPAPTYIDYMRYNVTVITDALK